MSDYKYTLTRFCLRSGQLTLPQSMLELFPSEGSFTVKDAQQNEAFTLTMLSPRKVSGLGGFFKLHHLEVNDQILIRLQESETYVFTPLPRQKEARFHDPDDALKLLDDLYEKATPLSEAEIRNLYNHVPADLALAELLVEDERFTLQDGRWQVIKPSEAEAQEAEQGVEVVTDKVTPGLEEKTEQPEVVPLVSDLAPNVVEEDVESPQIKGPRGPSGETKPKRASVTPYPRGVIFPGDAGLNSQQDESDLSQQQMAKSLLLKAGYRVEGLAHGQLMAHADLGRKHHSILVHIFPEKSKLDWAALLSRRREVKADYIAVFGHELDLIPFEAPAELARASLWSWKGLRRLGEVLEIVPLSPMDLESHFERDGLVGRGLERFERSVQARVAERGVFSAVLTRLAAMKAPTIFMLDDIADADLSREQALKVLDLLGQAPFHFVSKVDNGEFCLRFKVGDGLVKVSQYTLSLRDRLPNRRTERLHAVEAEGPAFSEMGAPISGPNLKA